MIIVMNDNKEEDIDNIYDNALKNIILSLTLTGSIKMFFYQKMMSSPMTDSSDRLIVNIYGHPHQQLQHLTYQLSATSYNKAPRLDS